MAANKPLYVDQGSDYIKTFTFKRSESEILDLNGCSARMMVREDPDSTKVLVNATTANQRLEVNVATGQITIHLRAQDTEVIKFEGKVLKAFYDLEIVDSIGKVTRLLNGQFNLSREITR